MRSIKIFILFYDGFYCCSKLKTCLLRINKLLGAACKLIGYSMGTNQFFKRGSSYASLLSSAIQYLFLRLQISLKLALITDQKESVLNYILVKYDSPFCL